MNCRFSLMHELIEGVQGMGVLISELVLLMHLSSSSSSSLILRGLCGLGFKRSFQCENGDTSCQIISDKYGQTAHDDQPDDKLLGSGDVSMVISQSDGGAKKYSQYRIHGTFSMGSTNVDHITGPDCIELVSQFMTYSLWAFINMATAEAS